MVQPRHDSATSIPSGAIPAQPPKRLRILVCEDNGVDADWLALLLRWDGHEVEVHHAARAFMHAASTKACDVAIIDMGLPEADGYELARTLRERSRARNAVLIAWTRYENQHGVVATHDARFDFHISKSSPPVSIGAIVQAVALGARR